MYYIVQNLRASGLSSSETQGNDHGMDCGFTQVNKLYTTTDNYNEMGSFIYSISYMIYRDSGCLYEAICPKRYHGCQEQLASYKQCIWILHKSRNVLLPRKKKR